MKDPESACLALCMFQDRKGRHPAEHRPAFIIPGRGVSVLLSLEDGDVSGLLHLPVRFLKTHGSIQFHFPQGFLPALHNPDRGSPKDDDGKNKRNEPPGTAFCVRAFRIPPVIFFLPLLTVHARCLISY